MILPLLRAMLAGWIPRHQQQGSTYLHEENRVLKAQLRGQRLRLTDTERRGLAALAHPLGRRRLKEIASIATPDTLLRWDHRRIAQKFDGSRHRRQLGRPRVAEAIAQLVVRMAEENPAWGHRRIQGALANVGFCLDALTVRHILRRHHLEPAPQRRKAGTSWGQFLTLHGEVLAATDFFTVEVATWRGLVTYYVLLVMELSTRRVHLAGITSPPTDLFMTHGARQLMEPCDGCLLGKRYRLHARDEKFVPGFDRMRRASGVEPVVLPPRSPHLNAHGERFVRSLRQEALHQMLVIGEMSLRRVIQSDVTHSHHERHHQGLANRLIASEPGVGCQSGRVVRRERLGGLLTHYYRETA
jgi:putative transposase